MIWQFFLWYVKISSKFKIFEDSIPTNFPKIVIWFIFLQVSLIVYIAAFSLGFGPLPWAMNAELFPVEAKVKATPLITA